MQIITTIQELRDTLKSYRKSGHSIGFVPTMGALHKGHISLLEQCLKKDDVAVASIYVNPTQFNDKNDLKNYPRDFDSDCEKLEEAGCRIVFAPVDEEMYPEEDTRHFDLGEMGNIMEGKFRPGHFNGVAQIVTRLFDVVQPDRAYFGKKDFQQLAIIKKLVKDLNYPVEIIGCPIIREPDGLAMSSRNLLLNDQERAAAPLIYQCLVEAKALYPHKEIPEIENYILAKLKNNPCLKPEYFQFVEALTLRPVLKKISDTPVNACAAVYDGRIRLIDNLDIIS